MILIAKAFFLSFGVMGRMVLPIIIFFIASSIVWSMLNFVSAGYADFLRRPINTAFVSLLGIRTALAILGDNRRAEYQIMVLYSVLYGVFFILIGTAVMIAVNFTVSLYANGNPGEALSMTKFVIQDRSLKFVFGSPLQNGISAFIIFMLASISVIMAVPLASAARAVGLGTPSAPFFFGVGRSFIPLFCIFIVAFFLQFFFGIFTLILAVVPLLASAVTLILAQTIPDFGIDVLLKGIAASAGLLWVHALMWAASALALLKFDQSAKHRATVPRTEVTATIDIAALRKSRQ